MAEIKKQVWRQCCEEVVDFLAADPCLAEYQIKKADWGIDKKKLSAMMTGGKRKGVCVLIHPLEARGAKGSGGLCVTFGRINLAITVLGKRALINDGDPQPDDIAMYIFGLLLECFKSDCLGGQAFCAADEPITVTDVPAKNFDCAATVRLRTRAAIKFTVTAGDKNPEQVRSYLQRREAYLSGALEETQAELSNLPN